jgi:hypothetical protein
MVSRERVDHRLEPSHSVIYVGKRTGITTPEDRTRRSAIGRRRLRQSTHHLPMQSRSLQAHPILTYELVQKIGQAKALGTLIERGRQLFLKGSRTIPIVPPDVRAVSGASQSGLWPP